MDAAAFLTVILALELTSCSVAGPPIPATPPQADFVTRLDGRKLALAEVDRQVRSAMDAAAVVGLALAVINDRQVVYQKAYGWRDAARRLPLRTDTSMYGASFTKAAFAHLVMQLVDEKVIDLDRPIQRYLPRPLSEYEHYRDLAGDSRVQEITARMLLSHTAGFSNYRFLVPGGKLQIHFPPGSRYGYSGEGINLLQLVVEQVTGRSVGELMQQRIFRRFAMARTTMVWKPELAADLALGHDPQGRSLGHRPRTRARAAGSMETTVADYARFLVGVLRGEGLSAASRREMLRPQIAITSRRQFPSLSTETTDDNRAIALGYGLGWGVFRSRHGRAFFKEGHEDGWDNHAVCFDEAGSCLLLMSNSENGDRVFIPLLQALMADHDTPGRWHGYGG